MFERKSEGLVALLSLPLGAPYRRPPLATTAACLSSPLPLLSNRSDEIAEARRRKAEQEEIEREEYLERMSRTVS